MTDSPSEDGVPSLSQASTTSPPPLPSGPTMESEDNPSPTAKRPFKEMIAAPAAIVFVIFAVSALWAGYQRHNGNEFWVSYGSGRLVGGLMIAWLIAALLFLVSGRSRALATGAFCAILLLSTAANLREFTGTPGSNGADIQAVLDTHRDEGEALRERSAAGEDVSEAQLSHFEKVTSSIEKQSAKLTGRDADIAKAMSVEMRRLGVVAKEYNDALAALQDAGGFECDRNTTRDQLAQKIALTDDLGEANERFSRVYAELPVDLQRRLKDLGIGERDRQVIIDGWRKGAQIDLIQAMRNCDRQIVESGRGMLTTLHDRWGTWRIDTNSNTIDFESSLDANAFDRYRAALDAAAAKQAEVQEQILRVQRQRAASRR